MKRLPSEDQKNSKCKGLKVKHAGMLKGEEMPDWLVYWAKASIPEAGGDQTPQSFEVNVGKLALTLSAAGSHGGLEAAQVALVFTTLLSLL